MTMQIVLVGTDGIVLASDTRWTDESQNVRRTGSGPKIRIDYTKGIAISFARKLNLGSRVADDLLKQLSDQEWQLLQLRGPQVAAEAIKTAKKGDDFQCLIVTTKPTLAAHHLSWGVYAGVDAPRYDRISNVEYAGDIKNAGALFWIERYYWRTSHHDIRNLIPLAAYAVFSSAKLNESGINGLQVVVCDSSGLRELTEESLAELQEQSIQWDQQIEEFFANHQQSYKWESSPEVSITKPPVEI